MARPSFIWYGLGAILYVLPSIGYIVFDIFAFVNVYLPDYDWAIAYTVLAVAFLVDAIFYFIAMAVYDPPFRSNRLSCTVGLWAEVMYVASATIYVVSATLLFPLEGLTYKARTISFFLAQAALNFSAVCGYVICAFLYNSRYYETRIDSGVTGWKSLFTDIYFWGELFNTVPSLGYMGTSLYQVFAPIALTDLTPNQLVPALRDVVFTMRSINVVFDFLFLINAVIYLVAWIRDERAAALGEDGEEGDAQKDSDTTKEQILHQWEEGLVELEKKSP